ncbi:MAG TPA: carbohydrate binding domain-containing protein, partial [Patescibacteria group bacterium]|nr:carbohydrate binding domain-containing protein [Patescibacteria group bacterium]
MALATLLVFTLVTSFTIFAKPAPTAAATSNTINFQARLMTGVGSIVPDGSYNVEFKLYNVSSGGSALWTEDYLNNASQGISVANGYLTANLGSLIAFPTTINWDQQVWLTMTVRGTGSCAFGSCAPTDAEMSPRLLLTAVPYAFKAGQLAQFNSGTGFTSTLSLVQPTVGNQIFQIQDQAAAGTYNLCIQNSSACGFATGSGAAFLQGGNTFSGVTAGDLGTNNNGVLNFRTNNATRATLSTNGDLTFAASNTITTSLTNGNLTLQANGSGTATLDTGASGTVAIGVSANNKTVNIGNVTNGNANTTTVSIATSTGAAQTINLGGNATSGGSNAGTVIKTQGGATALTVANAGATFQTFTNSATALQVQNAVGAPVLLVDTTSSDNSGATLNYLTYPGFESGSFTSGASGWVKTGATQVALAQNASKQHTYNGLFSVNVTTTATIGDGLQTASFNATPAANAYIVSFYAKVSSGTMASNLFTVTATDGATNPTCSPASGITLNASGFQRLFCSVTTGGNLTNLKIAQNDATARTIYIDAVQLQTNDFNGGTNNIAAPTPYSIGNIQLRGVITNPLALINSGDSTSAFQIQNTSGTSNTFVADTLNNKITIGGLNSAGIVTNTSGGVLGTVTTIPIANGGTNAASFSATNGVTYYDGSKLTVTAASTGAQCLITTSSGVAPTWGSCGTGTALTLQNTYDNSSSPATITSSSAAKTITLQSGATFNTTRFFEVAANGVAAPVLSVDTANQRVGVDLNNPAFALDVVGDINASLTLKVAGTTVCDSTGCSASPGGGNYIRNATAQQNNANYNIKSGVAGQTTAQITGSNSATVPVAIISSGTTPGAGADLLQLTDGTNVLAKFANTGVLTLGRAGAGTTGAIVLNNTTNANAITLTTGATSGSYNLVLPASAGNSGDCLKNGGVGGTLTFAACGSSGITTTLQNAYDNSSSPATITTSSG